MSLKGCCLSHRRLARLYAIEAVQIARVKGFAPETVTPESVVEAMQQDGLDTPGVDWNNVLGFLSALIQLLKEWFAVAPAPAPAPAPPAKK